MERQAMPWGLLVKQANTAVLPSATIICLAAILECTACFYTTTTYKVSLLYSNM
jgi:hypothetical protein